MRLVGQLSNPSSSLETMLGAQIGTPGARPAVVSIAVPRRLGNGVVQRAVVKVLAAARRPLSVLEVQTAVVDLLGHPVSKDSIKPLSVYWCSWDGGTFRADCPWLLSAQGAAVGGSAPDDLRDALVAHAHDLGNGCHRQALTVGRPYGFVSLLPELFGGLLQGCFAPGVVVGEGGQVGSGLGGVAFGAGDLRIV